ncbi:MAG: hypothetical protein ACFFCO_12790, partial [Promethearchaeota archaeon]
MTRRTITLARIFIILALIGFTPFTTPLGLPLPLEDPSTRPEGVGTPPAQSTPYSVQQEDAAEAIQSMPTPPVQMQGSGDGFSATEYARDDSFDPATAQVTAPDVDLWADLSNNFTSSFSGWTANAFTVNVSDLTEGDIVNDGSNGDYHADGPWGGPGHWSVGGTSGYQFLSTTYQGRTVAYTDLGTFGGFQRYTYMYDWFSVAPPPAGGYIMAYFTFYMHKPDTHSSTYFQIRVDDGTYPTRKWWRESHPFSWWIANSEAEDGFYTYALNCTAAGLNGFAQTWRLYVRVQIQYDYRQQDPNSENEFYVDMVMLARERRVEPSAVGLQVTETGGPWTIADQPGAPVGDGTNTTTGSWADQVEPVFSNSSNMWDYLLLNYTYQVSVSHTWLTSASSFTVGTGASATWTVDLTTLTISPGDATVGYWFTLDLPDDWSVTGVQHPVGTPRLYGWSWSGGIVTVEELIAEAGNWRFLATSPNYVALVTVQTNATRYGGGSWVNLTTGNYLIEGDYIRVWAKYQDVTNTVYGNVTLFFPNGTIWQSDVSASSHPNVATDTLTSQVWQVPHIEHSAASSAWIAQIEWTGNQVNSGPRQVGLNTTAFTVVIDTTITVIRPTVLPVPVFLQGNSTWVQVNFTEADNDVITDEVTAAITFTDLFGFPSEVSMTDEGDGNFSRYFDTGNLEPGSNRQITVVLAKEGYVNRTATITFQNLINPTELSLLRPTASVTLKEIDNATDYCFAYYEGEVAKTE